MADKIYINNIDLEDLGVCMKEGVYGVLRTPAKLKEGLTNNWPESNGTERDVSARAFESRKLSLPILIEGASEADFTAKYDALIAMLASTGYFDLKVLRLNRIYRLLYLEIQNYTDYYDYATMELVVVDDYPHQPKKIDESKP